MIVTVTVTVPVAVTVTVIVTLPVTLVNLVVQQGGEHPPGARMRVAVVGSGVAGLAAAWTLANAGATVVVYEKEEHIGGHAHTFRIEPKNLDVDLGFMVFNSVSDTVRTLNSDSYSDTLPLWWCYLSYEHYARPMDVPSFFFLTT